MTIQDFVHGVDFSGINPATGGDHNNLVDLAEPVIDGAGEAKGLNIWTVDTAADVPNVPQATLIGAAKWQHYLWTRIPFAGSVVKTPKLYAWNPDQPLDVTFLAWVEIVSDTASLQAQITAIANQIATVQATAVNAQTVANAANTTAGIANTNSQNALNQVAGATATANAAKTEADQAIAATTTLTADLNALQQIVSTLNDTTIPTVVNIQRSCALLAETATAGNDLAAAGAGAQIRNINQKDYDPQNLITLNAGTFAFNIAGTFRLRATIPFTYVYPGSGVFIPTAQSFAKKNADNSLRGQSTSLVLASPGANHVITGYMHLDCVITAAKDEVFRIDTHCNASAAGNSFLGVHANDGANWPVGAKEYYTTIEIQQLF